MYRSKCITTSTYKLLHVFNSSRHHHKSSHMIYIFRNNMTLFMVHSRLFVFTMLDSWGNFKYGSHLNVIMLMFSFVSSFSFVGSDINIGCCHPVCQSPLMIYVYYCIVKCLCVYFFHENKYCLNELSICFIP